MYGVLYMSYDRKLIRNGNGWALTLNSTILEFLGVDPKVNKVHYQMDGETLKVTKSQFNVEKDKK